MDLSRARRIPSPILLFPRRWNPFECKTIESLTFKYNEIKWGQLLSVGVGVKDLRQNDLSSTLSQYFYMNGADHD